MSGRWPVSPHVSLNRLFLQSARHFSHTTPSVAARILCSIWLRADFIYGAKVNSADKLYLVVESVKPDAKHNRSSTAPATTDGAGGSC